MVVGERENCKIVKSTFCQPLSQRLRITQYSSSIHYGRRMKQSRPSENFIKNSSTLSTGGLRSEVKNSTQPPNINPIGLVRNEFNHGSMEIRPENNNTP